MRRDQQQAKAARIGLRTGVQRLFSPEISRGHALPLTRERTRSRVSGADQVHLGNTGLSMGSLAGATIGKDARVWNGIRATALLLALCVAVTLTHFLPNDLRYGGYGVVGLLLLGPLVAMPRAGWFLLPLLWAGREALRYANEAKLSLTQVPLTSRDLRLALDDPVGLLDALQVPVLLRQAALALAAMALAWLLWQTGRRALVSFGRERGRLAVHAAVAGAVLAYAGCFAAYLDGFMARADAYAKQAGGRWDPQRMAELPRELGLEGFLAYSRVLERAHHGPFFERHGPLRPDLVAIRAAAARHLVRPATGPLPNIMLVLAESTFDPNLAFRLTRPVSTGMFRPRDRLTRAYGPLRVNVIGGGSWVSEFEAFTGLDNRLFGYAGYHTHVLLSPFVRGSFVHHLNDRGYVTEAYYPVEGTFYNARDAYRRYGFQRFADGPELGLARHWRATDLDVAEAVIRRSDPTAAAPFFKQVVFLENHAPHDCRPETSVETEFLDGASGRENCLLNEYVRRLHRSSRAFERLLDYLQQEERRSGRPFVLLIYGDHQPYTFTGTDRTFTDLTFAEFDFTRYRTALGRNVTFFHLLSSSTAVIACCGATMPPLTLLPSLLSLFVARSADETYLPVGFLAHGACPDLLLRNAISAGFDAPIEGGRSIAPACPPRGAILAAYQASGVMGGFAERP